MRFLAYPYNVPPFGVIDSSQRGKTPFEETDNPVAYKPMLPRISKDLENDSTLFHLMLHVHQPRPQHMSKISLHLYNNETKFEVVNRDSITVREIDCIGFDYIREIKYLAESPK